MSSTLCAAQRIADGTLFPAATRTERSGRLLPREHLDALAAAGLFGVYVPERYGGLELPERQVREVYAVLSGGCAATAFVWMQHQSLVRKLVHTDNTALAANLLPHLAGGQMVAGDVNYLRRSPPAVVARTVPGGYELHGTAPWVASWKIADVYIVAAVEEREGDALYFVVPTRSEGFSSAERLDVLALRASGCARLRLDGVRVSDDRLVERLPWQRWRERDARRTAQPMPPVFGLADRALRLLWDLVHDSRGVRAGAVASLAEEFAECKRRSWELADAYEEGRGVEVAEQLRARGESHALALRITGALVAAGGGRSVEAGSDAQRLLREIAFFSIQSQSAEVRAATLDRLAAPPSPVVVPTAGVPAVTR